MYLRRMMAKVLENHRLLTWDYVTDQALWLPPEAHTTDVCESRSLDGAEPRW